MDHPAGPAAPVASASSRVPAFVRRLHKSISVIQLMNRAMTAYLAMLQAAMRP